MNKELIGKKFSASLSPENEWVECSDGNDGEENYYLDVYDDYGVMVYCDGETCEVVGLDHKRDKVFMRNEFINKEEDYIFEISIEQFTEDFMKGGE